MHVFPPNFGSYQSSAVYGLIESSLKFSSKPRRSKSLSRSERYETRDTSLLEPPSQPQPLVSSDSTTSGSISGSVSPEHHLPRSSLDKGKTIKSFRSSSDRDMADPVFRVTLSRKSLVSRDGKDGAGVEEVRIAFGPSVGAIVLYFAYFTERGKSNPRL